METTETQQNTVSELALKCWSVISFDKHEASGLTYPEAVHRLAELEHQRIAGLCIVTDEAASRLAD